MLSEMSKNITLTNTVGEIMFDIQGIPTSVSDDTPKDKVIDIFKFVSISIEEYHVILS